MFGKEDARCVGMSDTIYKVFESEEKKRFVYAGRNFEFSLSLSPAQAPQSRPLLGFVLQLARTPPTTWKVDVSPVYDPAGMSNPTFIAATEKNKQVVCNAVATECVAQIALRVVPREHEDAYGKRLDVLRNHLPVNPNAPAEARADSATIKQVIAQHMPTTRWDTFWERLKQKNGSGTPHEYAWTHVEQPIYTSSSPPSTPQISQMLVALDAACMAKTLGFPGMRADGRRNGIEGCKIIDPRQLISSDGGLSVSAPAHVSPPRSPSTEIPADGNIASSSNHTPVATSFARPSMTRLGPASGVTATITRYPSQVVHRHGR